VTSTRSGITKSAAKRILPVLLLALGLSCATTGDQGEGDVNLPNAGVGPFRKLDFDEVRGIAPFVLDEEPAAYREPAVVGDGPSTIMYVVATRDGKDRIVRSRATDGRSFFGTSLQFGKKPVVVLSPDAPWEGNALAGPFVLRLDSGELLLFYAAAGGIGLARSRDGVAFTKEPRPVFARDPNVLWETTELRAPTAYVLPNGKLRMLYASGVSIGEAESADGRTWTRVDPEPVLGPAAPAPPGYLLPNEKGPFDTAGVSDPCASARITPSGRFHLRVLYTSLDPSGATTIGLAARYGDSGKLVRQTSPVYSANQKEAAPAFVEGSGGTFLYVQQERSNTGLGGKKTTYPAIAAAFAPANVHLPEPSDFPEDP